MGAPHADGRNDAPLAQLQTLLLRLPLPWPAAWASIARMLAAVTAPSAVAAPLQCLAGDTIEASASSSSLQGEALAAEPYRRVAVTYVWCAGRLARPYFTHFTFTTTTPLPQSGRLTATSLCNTVCCRATLVSSKPQRTGICAGPPCRAMCGVLVPPLLCTLWVLPGWVLTADKSHEPVVRPSVRPRSSATPCCRRMNSMQMERSMMWPAAYG
jgi:hypothetical protein